MSQLTNLSPDLSTQIAQHETDAKDLTRILPASKKVYVQGSRPDIQVPFREISLTDTPTGLAENGFEKNEADKTCNSLKKSNKSCIVIASSENQQLVMAKNN